MADDKDVKVEEKTVKNVLIKKGSVWHIVWHIEDMVVSTVFIRDATTATVEIVDQEDRSTATRYRWGAFHFIEEVPQVVH